MESENNNLLPNRWSQGKLAEIISHTGIVSDGDWIESKDQDPNGKVRLVQLADIGDGKFLSKSSRFMTTEAANRLNCTFLKEGDVLIARMPDPLGRACIFPQVEHQSVTVVDVCLIRPNENSALSNDLFKYWINTPQIRSEISLQATGSTRKRITRKKLSAFNFPVPPLPEQKRIVEKLDSLLAQVDTIQQRLNNLPDIIKRFRQSVLAAGVSGKLTEQWRGENKRLLSPLNDIAKKREELIKSGAIKLSKQNIPLPFDEPLSELPEGWDWSRLISISLLVTDGKHGNCVDEANSGYYFLSAKDVKNGKLHYLNAREINQKEFQEVHQRTNLEAGDICIVNTGATVGKLAIAQESPLTEKSTFQKSVAVIKLIKPYMNEKFMSFYLRDASERLLKSSTGSAVNNLLLSTMKQMAVPVPPVEEQTEIVRLVEQYFALADTLEKNLANAKQRVDNLTQSILAKAFKGELVPQNPNDEPADKLLERIKAAREEAEKLEKAAKKAAKASKSSKAKKI